MPIADKLAKNYLSLSQGVEVKKVIAMISAITLSFTLGACGSSSSDTAEANPSATRSDGYTDQQWNYLQEVYAAKLSASDVFSGEIYIEIGNTMCEGFVQGKQSDELLSLLAATAESNGLPVNDRKVFGPTILAASVAYLCPENIDKVVVK